MVVGQDFKTDTKKKANSICERSFSLPSKAVRLIGLACFPWFFPVVMPGIYKNNGCHSLPRISSMYLKQAMSNEAVSSLRLW